MPHQRLFTISEVALDLGVCRQRVHQIREEMGLGARLGKMWIFTSGELARMRKRNTRVGRPRG